MLRLYGIFRLWTERLETERYSLNAGVHRIGEDPPRHAAQASQMHRKKSDMEADEHEPAGEVPELLGELLRGRVRERFHSDWPFPALTQVVASAPFAPYQGNAPERWVGDKRYERSRRKHHFTLGGTQSMFVALSQFIVANAMAAQLTQQRTQPQ